MDKSLIIIIVQIVLIFALVAIITFFIRLNDTIKLEKRISKYSIKGSRNKCDKSYYDKVFDGYKLFVKKQRKKINKLFPSLVRRYDKYVTDGEVRATDYVTHKLVISILFVILTIIATVIQGKFITIMQFLISLILGFYILDIILFIVNKFKKKKIENDMLRAIIIMNNAFKSGKSTIQAVEIASEKLSKPISLEFKRMHQEMKYGLSVDVVFDRFAKRINLEEAEYLSSSLTILNRTGGNIVAVFNSIEKTLFDKKKLNEELKNSTTVSNLLVKILLFVPIVFVIIIYLLNPNYFDPFFESTTGYVLLSIILILFIVYAYLLERIVKVDY
ncbi:MAG: type II secretion system F family protein [Bacilli bacterium]|nr:type II secretion system F family protein [Bacilli bacterium]